MDNLFRWKRQLLGPRDKQHILLPKSVYTLEQWTKLQTRVGHYGRQTNHNGGSGDWLEPGIHPEIGALYLQARTIFGRVR
jgi:hypothetical protein